MEPIITVKQLKKSYVSKKKKGAKIVEAVKGIDFCVKKGQLFAFLGPNGAGKSTTIDILCTLSKPDSGTVTIDGYTLDKEDTFIRKSIGVVFQDSILDHLLTVRENLKTRANFYGMNKGETSRAIQEAARTADVTEFLDRPYGLLSGGQRRRADIARALIHTPKILFLDEPTTGLDPKTKEGVWKTVTALQKEKGMTVFLTTHYMEEAATADYITIMNRGEIAAYGTPYELQNTYSQDTLRLKPLEENLLIKILKDKKLSYQKQGELFIVPVSDTISSIPILNEMQPFLENFEVIHGSMEDVFLNITGGDINASFFSA